MRAPYLFDEFFASGMEESISPFLTPRSRKFGRNLDVKSALFAAFCLAFAFIFSFSIPPLSALLLSLVYFLVGTPALLSAVEDLRNFEINIDILMTLAAFLALLIDSGMEGALLLVLFELSHGMEHAVEKKTKSALHNLNQLSPKFAYVFDSEGNLYEKAVREIGVGERIFIKNGEIVPLDGKVVEGISSVNLVHLTGESFPVPKAPGDSIAAGARNLEAALTVEVERISAESTLSRMIRLILSAGESKPKLQRWLDRFGKRYASAIILLTFAFALFLPLLFSMSYWGKEGSVYRALAFLIAASPCALIIATPTAYLSAMSACARRGILLKGGTTLDALSSCSAIAFDKTGTLTLGRLSCLGFEAVGTPSLSLDTALELAYGLERNVTHPIAEAICNLASTQKKIPAPISDFRSIAGYGLVGNFEGKSLFIGLPEKIIETLSPPLRNALQQRLRHLSGEIFAALSVGEDLFLFRFSDQIRPRLPELIREIKKTHRFKTIMLTGDNEASAQRIAALLGIEDVQANLRPEDKLAKVIHLSETGGLAMVGDGINDAPALARATVGISMGKVGSWAAVDASDVVFLNDDLHLLSWLFSKARKTLRVVKQNLGAALCVIGFATLPALLGLVPLWAAVILHEGGTVLVGINSLRLLKGTPYTKRNK